VAAAADQQPEAKPDKQQKQQKQQKGQKQQQQQQKQGGGECNTAQCSHIRSYVCMFLSVAASCLLTGGSLLQESSVAALQAAEQQQMLTIVLHLACSSLASHPHTIADVCCRGQGE
jgi:hypothetical protein